MTSCAPVAARSQPAIDAHRHELLVTQPEEPIWLDADLTRLGLRTGDRVCLTSADGAFTGRLRAAAITPGNLEVHWPEGNVLLSGSAIDPESLEPDYNASVVLTRA